MASDTATVDRGLRPPQVAVRVGKLAEPQVLAVIVAVVLALVYIAWSPLAPDVAAQSGRAAAVRLTHIGTWWSGWFGGLPLVSYSVLVPLVIAVLGVPLTGAAAVVGTAAVGGCLVRSAVRPRAGAIAIAVAGAADVLCGRITFAVGTTVALAAALMIQRRRTGLSCGFAATSVLCSPLAGLFLGIGALTLVIGSPARRRPALYVAGSLLAVGLTLAVLSPGTGRMPFSARDLFGALCATAAVALLCPQRLLRIGAALMAATEVFFFLVPSSVGVNVGRLTAVFGAAAVVAFSQWHRLAALLAAVALTIGPGVDLTAQVSAGRDASAQRAFYQPLVHEIVQRRGMEGAEALGQRVEIVEPRTHGDANFVAPTVPLARGWYRQADVANNPLFYSNQELTARSYRKWLDTLAVRWVGVPNTPLDYASVKEAQFIGAGLPYLHPIWRTGSWTLYEVDHPRPIVDGALAVPGPDGLGVAVGHRGAYFLRVRWSPALAVHGPLGTSGARLFDADGWVGLDAPDPGRYVLGGRGLF